MKTLKVSDLQLGKKTHTRIGYPRASIASSGALTFNKLATLNEEFKKILDKEYVEILFSKEYNTVFVGIYSKKPIENDIYKLSNTPAKGKTTSIRSLIRQCGFSLIDWKGSYEISMVQMNNEDKKLAPFIAICMPKQLDLLEKDKEEKS